MFVLKTFDILQAKLFRMKTYLEMPSRSRYQVIPILKRFNKMFFCFIFDQDGDHHVASKNRAVKKNFEVKRS